MRRVRLWLFRPSAPGCVMTDLRAVLISELARSPQVSRAFCGTRISLAAIFEQITSSETQGTRFNVIVFPGIL